jgi:L,D-transpeptidase YbiS
VERDKDKLWRKIVRLSPKGVYVVIDTARNMLYIKKDSSVLREALISCGSGNILEDPVGRRKWVFDTPRGTFFITSKVKNPSWIKPDWAFIEEGEAVPVDSKKRIETGVLGDYALGFGDGYFIHGTLYTRLLGRNVTHGCIRVGDKDLEHLFHTTSVGTVIFIF